MWSPTCRWGSRASGGGEREPSALGANQTCACGAPLHPPGPVCWPAPSEAFPVPPKQLVANTSELQRTLKVISHSPFN